MMNTALVFKPRVRPFVAVAPCPRCGKPVGSNGQHQYLIGLRFCLKKMVALRRAA